MTASPAAEYAPPILLDRRTLRWYSKTFVSKFGGLAEVTDLDCGDAVWWWYDSGSECVEYKKTTDIVESVYHSGRLVEQIRKALQFHTGYTIIWQGEIRVDRESGRLMEHRWSRERHRFMWSPVLVPGTTDTYAEYRVVDNSLNSLQRIDGVTLRRARDEDELVQQTIDLYLWTQKPLESHRTTVRDRLYSPNSFVQVSLVRKWAADIAKIGPKLSREVESRVPSAAQLAALSVEEWTQIPGIGKGIAKAAYDEIRRERYVP